MAGTKHLHLRNVKKGSIRLDRHSGSGRAGTPKKGGAGGKHTWGVAGMESDVHAHSALNKFDPNFSEEETEEMENRVTLKVKEVIVEP